jgi:hypothetical protein
MNDALVCHIERAQWERMAGSECRHVGTTMLEELQNLVGRPARGLVREGLDE